MPSEGTGGAADTIASPLCLEFAQIQIDKIVLASPVCSSRFLTFASVGKYFQVYVFKISKFCKQISLFSMKVIYFFNSEMKFECSHVICSFFILYDLNMECGFFSVLFILKLAILAS